MGKRGQPTFLYCISLRRLLDAVPHITPLSSRLLIEIGATLQEEVVGMELRGPVLGAHADTGLGDHVCEMFHLYHMGELVDNVR